MIIITLFLLLVPGIISLRILWRGKSICKSDIKFLVADYLIYSFLIMLVGYAFMFFSNVDRTVAFSANVYASSSILLAGFVFKYSFVALIAALTMPVFVPWLCKMGVNLEANRKKRIESEKKEASDG